MLQTQEEILNELFSSPNNPLPIPPGISPAKLKLFCEKEILAMTTAGFCPAYTVHTESGTIFLSLSETIPAPPEDFPEELIPALDALISGKRIKVESRAIKRRLFFRAAQLHIPLTAIRDPQGAYIIQTKRVSAPVPFQILED